MDKKFLFFITKDKLLVYDIERKEYIGINDNTYSKYDGNTDIKNFCACIANQFNEESFADLAATVTIVNCDANLLFVDKLYNALEGCKEKNVLNVERILPFVAFNNGLKKNEEMIYEVINQYYLLKRNDVNGVICSLAEENNSAKELLPTDFDFLFDFVGVNHWDEEKEKSLVEYKSNFEKLNGEYERLKNDYEKLNMGHTDSQKTKLVEEMANVLAKQSTSQLEYTDKRMRFKTIQHLAMGQQVTLVSMKTDGFNSFVVKFFVSNGDIVAKNDCVAKFYKPDNLSLAEAVLIAPFAGRFYSVLKDDCVEGGTIECESCSYFFDVGIFANPDYTETDVYKVCNWGKLL